MLSVLFLLILSFLSADARDRTWNFDAEDADKEPTGFLFEDTRRAPDGKWRVVTDGSNKVLAQLDKNRDDNRYTMAVVKDSAVEDVRLSVRIKAVKGDRDQAGGLVWRYRNAENYLVARLDVTERNVRLYRFVNGNRVQFGVEDDLDIKRDRWYTLRVEHKGREVKVYLDDDILLIRRDRHFTRPGKFGLWTKSDSVMHFDDFNVRDLDDDR